MDEHTLNDLLECSVCLERLDISSKVLPCQHTFCRKCLEVIFESYRELRCPECRLLVDIKIDDLPTNVLLMRILEGMKNAVTTNKKNVHDVNDYINTNQVISDALGPESLPHIKNKHQQKGQTSSNYMQNNISRQQKYLQPSNATATNGALKHLTIPHAYAIHDFESIDASDLKFKKGDLIILKSKIDENWFVGQREDTEGTFPSNYVQVVVPLKSPLPQCIALYDFKMGPNEEEGCLSFNKGTVIEVIRRIDHNWAEGRIGSSIGIFPTEFVELNSLARKLLDIYSHPDSKEISCPTKKMYTLPSVPMINATLNTNASTTSNGITSPIGQTISTNRLIVKKNPKPMICNTNCINNSTSPAAENSQGSTKVIKSPNITDPMSLRNKRHSLNMFLHQGSATLSFVQNNRHSAEILNVPNELSNEPSTSSAISNTCQTIEQQSPSQIQNIQHSIHSNLSNKTPQSYIALYSYKPRKIDELELIKGCVYVVIERCLDGWFKGINWEGNCGMLPGNYVTPVKFKDQQQALQNAMRLQPSNILNNTHLLSTSQLSTVPSSFDRQPLDNAEANNNPPDLPPRHLTHINTNVSSVAGTMTIQDYKENTIFKDENTAFGCIASITSNSSSSPSLLSSSSTSNNLKKFLIHIKARSKSPNSTPPHSNNKQKSINAANAKVPPIQKTTQNNINIPNAVHIRSGSCPSQLLPHVSKQNPMSTKGDSYSKAQQVPTKLNKANNKLTAEVEKTSIDSTLRSIYAHQIQQQQQKQRAQYPTNCNNTVPQIALHRKSHSLDASNALLHRPVLTSSTNSSNTNTKNGQFVAPRTQVKVSNTNTSITNTQNHSTESHYRCIVPYSPNSDVELELRLGDVILVQRKHENGWYKGTNTRTNKTGLFLASYVEPYL